MSAPAVSTRTIIRDTVMQVLESRKGQTVCRVKSFAVSPRFLTEQETKQANTYCVIVTDEDITVSRQSQRDISATVKLVLYAHDTKDPRAVLDAMIEDIYEVMLGSAGHADLRDLVWQVMPETLTTDEATTAAGPWAQALWTWTLKFSRA